uniref:Uncharacterized protein n=1 Tax=Nelumbo nucifera TaxID=4432 RepID=A0A822Y729_NELNU|nr:TPA_asm: hypothetical protein HUJ06_028607 [Nelumbo nucifera]
MHDFSLSIKLENQGKPFLAKNRMQASAQEQTPVKHSSLSIAG